MTPTGAVNGRIQDGDNKPLSGVPVELLKPGYDASGQRVLRKFGTAQTNDLGEYRLYFLTPGTYSLSAAPQPGIGDYRSRGPNEVRETFAPAVYPNTIQVQPGVTTRGIDLTLQRQRLFRVRGRIVDSSTGQVQLRRRDPATGEDQWLDDFGVLKNGVFEFSDVPPGSYSVTASVKEPVKRFGMVPVTVVDSDVNDVSITVKPGATISGRVRGEGGEALPFDFWGINTGIGRLQGAKLTPYVDDLRAAPAGLPMPEFSLLGEGGAFQVSNLMPGEYLFSIPRLGGQYVKEAWFGSADILNRPLRFTGSESGTLDVVLSSKMGRIDGKVTTERLEPAAGVHVALVPDRERSRTALFKATMANQNGSFYFEQIVPGDYRLFTWESLEPYASFNPELLRQSESRSVRVHVGESSKQTVELQVIPAP
jgi:hypothetical protein